METIIEVKTSKGDVLKGILIKETETYFTIKLSSGYNANILKKETKVLSKKENNIKKTTSQKKTEIKKDKNLANVSLLHTGGTIAAKVDYETGAVSSKFTPEELLNLYPELNKYANITPKMTSNLSSEDMRFEHVNSLLKEIENEVKNGCDAIIISHGTDTMHYTSSMLFYALKNIPVPIILVGSQRSSDRPSADGYLHLTAALQFISKTFKDNEQFRSIGICMHSGSSDEKCTIYNGINVKKMHSSTRHAFKQINEKEFCQISKDGNFEIFRKDLLKEKPVEKLKMTLLNPKIKIGFFKAHPNTFPEEIETLSFYDAVIIEGTGIGNMPLSQFDDISKINVENLDAVKKLITTTKVITGVQSVEGITDMNIYSSGRRLKEAGALGQKMRLITETLFSRTAYCLSQKELPFEDMWDKKLE